MCRGASKAQYEQQVVRKAFNHDEITKRPEGAAARGSWTASEGQHLSQTDLCIFKIDDTYYDVTKWRDSHPGGPEILNKMHGCDATDAFYAMHSQAAIRRLKNLPKAKLDKIPAKLRQRQPTKTETAFRELVSELEEDGFMERVWWKDLLLISHIFVLFALGTYLSPSYPILSIVLIGVSMQQAGWVGHDFHHSRGPNGKLYGGLYGEITALINAFDATWWDRKHNNHHIFPNMLYVDLDIHNEPVFHLWFPPLDDDVFYRQFQHWYMIPAYGLLYASWRIQSAQRAWKERNWQSLALIVANYAFMLSFLSIPVILGSIYLGGLLVGVCVTVTHQSEEIFNKDQYDYDFAAHQFRSTRNVTTNSFLAQWFWGGMDFQLEHHLFPMMPKYNFPTVSKRVQKWARDQGIEYRASTLAEIMQINYTTIKRFSGAPPKKQA